jgi:uncharacterized membrane protein
MAAGILGGLLAAVPGFIDYLSIHGPTRRIATWHMVLNVVTLAVFTASLLLRTAWGTQWVPAGSSLPQAISLVAAVILGVAGWLGGHLVYVHRMGVQPGANARDDLARRRAA